VLHWLLAGGVLLFRKFFRQTVKNQKYGSRIGLLGGIDLNDLCLLKPQEIFDSVVEKGKRFRARARGYALGSGNSIPDYIPVDGFMAMIEAAKKIRADESVTTIR